MKKDNIGHLALIIVEILDIYAIFSATQISTISTFPLPTVTVRLLMTCRNVVFYQSKLASVATTSVPPNFFPSVPEVGPRMVR